MINHHPTDDFLLALAAGRLAAGPALLVSVHLESCVACRERLHALQAVGGALLEQAAPELLAPEALARTLERIDMPAPAAPAAPVAAATATPRPSLPAGTSWPASLRGCAISDWHWMGPGMRYARIALPQEKDGTLWALQIAPGRSLARHTHTGLELTQVLRGAFDDGRSVFGPGDFDATDSDVRHQPVVQEGTQCVCLAYVEGNLRFEGRIAGLIGGWIGM
ncbi:ChrR family anti-sigma-E factor [Ramlibacter ginsenosidimutans]|nr:ChrR family anti-sigma-E factor [Ramlibacter ginsenosidimutans]